MRGTKGREQREGGRETKMKGGRERKSGERIKKRM